MIVVHGVVLTYKARRSSRMLLIQVPHLVELILSMKELEWIFLPHFCKHGKQGTERGQGLTYVVLRKWESRLLGCLMRPLFPLRTQTATAALKKSPFLLFSWECDLPGVQFLDFPSLWEMKRFTSQSDSRV